MTPQSQPRPKSSRRIRFICGACDTDLTRLTRPAPLPRAFGLCCEAMALTPVRAPGSAH